MLNIHVILLLRDHYCPSFPPYGRPNNLGSNVLLKTQLSEKERCGGAQKESCKEVSGVCWSITMVMMANWMLGNAPEEAMNIDVFN